MHPNVGTSTANLGSGENASIKLRVGHFDLVMNMLGCTTGEARAELIGMDPAAVSRARRGRNVSDKFVASTLAALGRHRNWFADRNTPITYEALFDTVTDSDSCSERVA